MSSESMTSKSTNTSKQLNGADRQKRFSSRIQSAIALVSVVMALCAWVAWKMEIVRERRAIWSIVSEKGALRETVERAVTQGRIDPQSKAFAARNPCWLRRLLGDEAVRVILVPDRPFTTLEEQARLHRAYPEAGVWVKMADGDQRLVYPDE